jgi:hypothetical protein
MDEEGVGNIGSEYETEDRNYEDTEAVTDDRNGE